MYTLVNIDMSRQTKFGENTTGGTHDFDSASNSNAAATVMCDFVGIDESKLIEVENEIK